ncbi:MAG: hypothetical protein LIP10_09740 [Clostridiales bacterium]|nr:hypothetical protein [Clostridiales bacterium]
MNRKGNSKVLFFLAAIFILGSLLMLWVDKTVIGITWLCSGIIDLIGGLIRRSKENKSEEMKNEE